MACSLVNAYASTEYFLVFDAGSSGTRMGFFEVTPAFDSDHLPNIKSLIGRETHSDTYRVTPGITDFVDRPSDLWDSLEPLFSRVSQYMQEHNIDHDQVSVYLYATAGARLVAADEREHYFKQIRKKISEHTKFKNIGDIGMISGEQEGVFAWLAVNYENLANDQATYVVLDLGGASMQISANLGINPELYNLDYQTFMVNGKAHHIASASFLGFGLNLVLSRVSSYWQQSYNVCLPKKYTADYIDNLEYIAFSYWGCQRLFSHYILARGEYNASFRHIVDLINSRPDLIITGLDNFYFVMDYFDANTPAQLSQAVEARCSGNTEGEVPFLPKSFTDERECPKAVYLSSIYRILGFDYFNPEMQFYHENWSKGVVASIILK